MKPFLPPISRGVRHDMSPDLRDNGRALLPDVTLCSLPLPSGFFLRPKSKSTFEQSNIYFDVLAGILSLSLGIRDARGESEVGI